MGGAGADKIRSTRSPAQGLQPPREQRERPLHPRPDDNERGDAGRRQRDGRARERPGVDVTLTDTSFKAGGLTAAISSIETARWLAPSLKRARRSRRHLAASRARRRGRPSGPSPSTEGSGRRHGAAGQPGRRRDQFRRRRPAKPEHRVCRKPERRHLEVHRLPRDHDDTSSRCSATITIPAPTWTSLTDSLRRCRSRR